MKRKKVSQLLKIILPFALVLLFILNSGHLSQENETMRDVIVGDPIIASGNVADDVDKVTIVMKGDDIKNKHNVIVKYGNEWKFRGLTSTRTFKLDEKLKLKLKVYTDTYRERGFIFYRYIPYPRIDGESIQLFKNGEQIDFPYSYNHIRYEYEDNKFIELDYRAKDHKFLKIDIINVEWRFIQKMDNTTIKNVTIHNKKYKTQFDTSQLGGGKYIIEVYGDKLIDSYEFNIIPANIEELSINRVNDIYGTPVTAVVTINNPENEEKSSNLNLFLDGSLYQTKSFSLPQNSFTNIEFTLNDISVGTHKIKVGTLEKTIGVKPVPNLHVLPVTKDIGIGLFLNLAGTSNSPDNTKVNLIIKKQNSEDTFAQKTATIKNGRFSASFDTAGADETVYTVTAKTPDGLSDSIQVTFIKLYSKFEITDLSLSDSSVILGTPITATATLKNNGNIEGSAELAIKVDNIEKETKRITIKPNSIRQVSFTIEEGIGMHEVSIEGFGKTKTFEVKPTPNLILDSISDDIHIGDKLTISGTTNMPDGRSILITANTDSAQLIPQTTVTGNGRFSATFETTGAKQGIYKVNSKTTDGTSSDLISVYLYKISPEISISLGLSQKEIVTGQKERVIVTLTNTAGTPITKTLNLKLDGNQIDTRTVTVGDIEIVEFTIENPAVGTHLVDVNGYQTQFTVLPIQGKSEIGFQLRADRTIINNGEESILTLSATNIITKPPMEAQFILTIPAGVQVTSTELIASGGGQYSTTYTLKPGDSKYISARIQGKEEGNFVMKGRLVYHFGDISDKHDEIQMVEITVN